MSPARTPGVRTHDLRPSLNNPASVGDLFALIRDGSAVTRSELGRLTGLSRTAVTARLAVLIASGLVHESQEGTSGVGRPAARLAFNARAGLVCAAAIGRSRTQLALCDLAGAIVSSADFDQEVGIGPDQLMPRVVRGLRRMLARGRHDASAVRGIGLSIPGTVDGARCCSYESPIMTGWHGVPLDSYCRTLTDAPVFLDTDTNTIALAERDGQLRHVRDGLVVKASTGFGAAVVSGGTLHRGAIGAAGEIGHVKYGPASGRACRCGETGCLEAVAGGWVLVNAMRESGEDVAHIRDVVALAVDGNRSARRQLRDSGRHFGAVLAAAVTLVNPGLIVIGGDMAPAFDLFAAGLRETLYRDATALTTRDLHIVATTHGEQTGVRGCATLVLDNVLDPRAIDHAR